MRQSQIGDQTRLKTVQYVVEDRKKFSIKDGGELNLICL